MKQVQLLPTVCVVCGNPASGRILPVSRQSGVCEPCCTDLHCQQVLMRRTTMDARSFANYLSMQAQTTKQRRAQARQRLALQAIEAQENARAIDAIQPLLCGDLPNDPHRVLRTALPSGPTLFGRLPRERRRRYGRYLIGIINQALQNREQGLCTPHVNEPVTTQSDYGAMTSQLCAVCRGGCCTKGAEHAFLQPESIQSFMALHPDHTARQILCAYLRRLPHVSMLGGCVNQTDRGCNLPRAMRSDPCNQFVCPSMALAQRREQQAPMLQAMLVVQRSQDHWQQIQGGGDNRIVGLVLIGPEGFVRLPLSE